MAVKKRMKLTREAAEIEFMRGRIIALESVVSGLLIAMEVQHPGMVEQMLLKPPEPNNWGWHPSLREARRDGMKHTLKAFSKAAAIVVRSRETDT